MSSQELQALQNAAASSAMEGLPLTKSDMETIRSILEGELSLQDYLAAMKASYGGAS